MFDFMNNTFADFHLFSRNDRFFQHHRIFPHLIQAAKKLVKILCILNNAFAYFDLISRNHTFSTTASDTSLFYLNQQNILMKIFDILNNTFVYFHHI